MVKTVGIRLMYLVHCDKSYDGLVGNVTDAVLG